MEKTRLEAFSDGVIAIIITIMVLEIHVPETADRETVFHILPSLISYILSFLIIGIYWNNHHHLFLTVKKISSRIMWANLNFLFWLSLVPFATAWMGKTKFNEMTVVVYAILLLLNGFSFEMLRKSIIRTLKKVDLSTKGISKLNLKTKISIALYTISIPIAFWNIYMSLVLFALVAILWIVPSKSIENEIDKNYKT